MLVEIGNHDPVLVTPAGQPIGRPSNGYLTTRIHVPDPHIDRNNGVLVWGLEDGLDIDDFRNHLTGSIMRRNGITQRPDHEALVALTHLSNGLIPSHAASGPAWVACEGEGEHVALMQRYISELYQCPEGRPADYEGDYWRSVGKRLLAPGVTNEAGDPPVDLVTNIGRKMWDDSLGGGQVGLVGLGTTATATTLTSAAVASQTANVWAGYRIYVYSTTGTLIVWGLINANTSGTTPVYTVDQWYSAGNPGGSAATTPTTPWSYMIADGGGVSAWFMGIAIGGNAPVATDVQMSTNGNTEQTANGLARKITAFAITSATTPTTFTWTVTFTYSTTGSVVITTAAQFMSNVKSAANDAVSMLTEDALSASATVNASGDQVTITATETGP